MERKIYPYPNCYNFMTGSFDTTAFWIGNNRIEVIYDFKVPGADNSIRLTEIKATQVIAPTIATTEQQNVSHYFLLTADRKFLTQGGE